MRPLTPRQREVLALVADGLMDKEIARKLDLSLGTVKDNVRMILLHLEANNRTHAVVIAIRSGLVGVS